MKIHRNCFYSINLSVLLVLFAVLSLPLNAQSSSKIESQKKKIISLVDQYSQARETKDAELLTKILTKDIDQLVSSGTWRKGFDAALEGMMGSSTRRPGSRTLTVESIRFITKDSALADARYEVTNADGSMRKMWSTFVVVQKNDHWKIAAIRNMLPAK